MPTKEFLQARKSHLLNKRRSVLDDLTRMAGRPVDQRIEHKRYVLLPLIDAALKRIEKGNYGACADCDEQIDVRRLQTRPEAVRCIGCQTAKEAANARR
jgi:DnaK suppressor protein